jgi:hypothetical protein
MEPNYSKREIDMLIKEIHNDVKDGFKGVHDRLDKLNGQTAKNTEFRLKSEGVIGLGKWVGFANVVAIAAWIISAFSK